MNQNGSPLDLPNGWSARIVKELASINEKNLKKNTACRYIEYIDIDSVEEGVIRKTTNLSLNEAPTRAKRVVQDKDILISSVRPNLKHYCRIKGSKSCTIASTGFVVLTPRKIDSDFLYYSITTNEYTSYLSAIAETSTTAYPSITAEVIAESIVPCPPEKEQKVISKILADLDSKIELNQQMNKTLESTAQAIFKHWFIDFEFPDENGNPYKSSEGEMVDSELGEIPKGWNVEKIAQSIDLRYGKSLRQDRRQEGYVPVFGSNGVVGYNDKHLVEGPGIIIGRKGTVGEVRFSFTDFWPIDTTYYVEVKNGTNITFWYYLLSFLNLDRMNSHSAVPGLNKNQVLDRKSIKPPSSLVNLFGAISAKILEKIDLSQRESTLLVSIRDFLLPKLMSGKIRVPLGDTDE
ncbi:hypothetical protein IX51_00970 [uncultured archaeon]|nr:hypothetical protein IX51_00970 [uncultured archaeon]